MVNKETILEDTKNDAEANGFYLCPDEDLLNDLLEGLTRNEERFGYRSCPCRNPSGIKIYDSDIICPCEYRDADVNEYGMCYCGLYVSQEVSEDPSKLKSIPERRPDEVLEAALDAKEQDTEERPSSEPELIVEGSVVDKSIPIWRCEVCGYLAARETPPSVCPICKAKADRFVKFTIG
jgi:ferredoxin-thioredoxin reductase catalytic subunit